MEPLRVLTVTNMYPTPGRPIMGTFVGEEVVSLRRRGIAVDVLFIDGPGSKMNYLRGVRELREAITPLGKLSTGESGKTDYDLIHAHYVFCGMIALTQRRLPVVLTQHGIEVQTGWTAPLSRWTSRRVTHTIATSTRVAAALRSCRITILPCGVDTDLFCPMDRGEARRVLGLPAAGPLVLFVGDPRPEKRLPLIRAAFELLRARVPGAQLLLVHDEPRERIPVYMNACDVLVLASVAEGSPMVVREALACNLPVVSTDVGDVKELISGVTRCHIALPDPSDLADKLGHALVSAERSDGRARILPWSLDAVAARLEEVYRLVLSRNAEKTSQGIAAQNICGSSR